MAKFPASTSPVIFHTRLLKTIQTSVHNLNSFTTSSSSSPTACTKTTTIRRFQKWNSSSNNSNGNGELIIRNPILLLIENGCHSMSQLKQIQAHMTRTSLITHIFPVSRLLYLCALSHFGDINHAHLIFTHQIPHPNIFIYNTMIKAYYSSSSSKFSISSSLLLFRWMLQHRICMDNRTFVFALKGCEKEFRLVEAQQLHSLIYKLGFNFNIIILNTIIYVYAIGYLINNARSLFDNMTMRDVFSWTTLINGYVHNNLPQEALKLFYYMLSSNGDDVEPNEVTMITVLSACSLMGSLRLGKSIHGYVQVVNKVNNLNLLNALLDMYVKCGCLITARKIFDKMEMKDVYTWTSMINGYAKRGELKLARELFDQFPQRQRNVVCWNTMIAGYSQKNKPEEAMQLFYEMEMEPVEATLVCVLSACAQLGWLNHGQKIYHYYVDQKRVRRSVSLANAFIDMCAKCGSIDAAANLFHEMPEKNLVSWNTMIVGYALHGYAEQALSLFTQMKSLNQLKPDDITLVGILSACSHGGLVVQGLEYFENMTRDFGIEPKAEHYACVVDLLGRVGHLEEAFELIKRMPMKPDQAAWGALLNACNMYGNVDLGKLASVELLNLDPQDSGTYVLLATMYASKRKWEDVSMARSMMRAKGIKKTPGCSSIEVNGHSHQFLVADISHSQSKEIYKLLDDMLLLLKLEGYVPKPQP